MSEIQIALHIGDDRPNGRRCGSCTLCCKLMPVEELAKPALQRCRYQSHRGCKEYHRLGEVSASCKAWNCRWLVDDAAAELHRPDRTHYVIDITPDFIGVRPEGGEEIINQPVMQIWIDPDFPHAHHDPALRRYIAKMAEERGESGYDAAGGRRRLCRQSCKPIPTPRPKHGPPSPRLAGPVRLGGPRPAQ